MNTSSLLLAIAVLLIKFSKSESRYCPEAVASANIVAFCPTSIAEWHIAARKKNCSKLAQRQKCSTVEKFLYHCVINEYRNETLEVCAPSRIIFGHCVEFNAAGGVIQEQISAPCNSTFPKCDTYYKSNSAYKYPECYSLIYKRSFRRRLTNISRDTNDNEYDAKKNIPLVLFLMFLTVIIIVTMVNLHMECWRNLHAEEKNKTRKNGKCILQGANEVLMK